MPLKKASIMIAAADADSSRILSESFSSEVFDFFTAREDEFVDKYKEYRPEVVILDVDRGYEDGRELIRAIRAEGNSQIIVLSQKDDVIEKILALESGADDYVVKPYDQRELVARVKVAVRHAKMISAASVPKETAAKTVVEFPGLYIDKKSYNVRIDGNKVSLSPKELGLLFALASQPDTVLSRDYLLRTIWGFNFYGKSRTVDVHVKRLRNIIDTGKHDWDIVTVWGAGYKFVSNANAARRPEK